MSNGMRQETTLLLMSEVEVYVLRISHALMKETGLRQGFCFQTITLSSVKVSGLGKTRFSDLESLELQHFAE